MKKAIYLSFIACLVASITRAQCNCRTSPETRWSGITIKKNRTGSPQKITCGYQFNLTCKDTIWFSSGRYLCEGSCIASYKANIFKGTALLRTLEPFVFTTNYLTFSTAAAYKVEIRPVCGGTSCQPCLFYFNVTTPGCR